MTPPAHTALGYIIAKSSIALGLVPPDQQSIAIITGMITGNLPDFDIVLLGRLAHHRNGTPFHKPLFWIFTSFAWIIFAKLSSLDPHYPIVIVALLGLLSHFIADSTDGSNGISWFWPFSDTVVHAYTSEKHKKNHKYTTKEAVVISLTSKARLIDFAVVIVAFIIFFLFP